MPSYRLKFARMRCGRVRGKEERGDVFLNGKERKLKIEHVKCGVIKF